MSLLTGMNDILKNEAAIEAANDMTLFDEELVLEADEFIDAMVDGEDEYEHPDDIDLMEEEDEEDDLLNEDLDIADEGLIKNFKEKRENKVLDSLGEYGGKDYFNTEKSKLIARAKKTMNGKWQANWARTGTPEHNEENLKKLQDLKIGLCWKDASDNYIAYSFKTKKFYFFDHEYDVDECLSKEMDFEKVVSYIEQWKSDETASESFTDFDIYESEVAMEGALETLRNAVVKLCDSLWRKCTKIAGKTDNEKKKKLFSDAADKFYNLSEKCKKANDEASLKKDKADAEKLAEAVDKAIDSGEDIQISLNSFIDSPEYKMMEAAAEAYDIAKMEYEAATEAAALTGQSFLQSLLLNDDPITTKNGSIGYQDSAANYKDNYSNSFANDNDAIKTENGSVGQKNTAANYKENFSAEFANDNDNIKAEDGSLGPKTSSPNPAIESAMFFGDVMGEEVAMEGLIKNFKEKISAKRDAKRADILSKMGVTDIDTNKFNELYNQGKLDQAMKMAANFGKKLEDGLKKLEDKSDIKAAKRLIKTNSALMIGLETDKKVAEYVKGGMSEKDARKLVVKEMKKKAEKIEDPAQEAFITDCIDLVVAFEASVGQNDTAADHSDNYSGGDLDDTDPIDTEDGEDVGDEKASANPATESDLEAELQLLNDTLLGDEDDDLDL